MKKTFLITALFVVIMGLLAAPAMAASNNYYYYNDRYSNDRYSNSYYSYNYDSWFDISRINAIDSQMDLRDEASREEVALIIAEICDEFGMLPNSREIYFSDSSRFLSSQSYNMVSRLTATPICYGYKDGTFRPDAPVSRAEAVAFVMRIKEYLNIDVPGKRNYSSYARVEFRDIEGHWAQYDITDAANLELVNGYNGYFRPDDEVTRQEFLEILIDLFGESNNPLISAIDKVYMLVFDNSIYTENNDRYYDDRYNNRYNNYNSDYEELTKRPDVDTGSTSGSTSSSTSNSKPKRPDVDTTQNSTEGSTNRPTVENGSDNASTRPARPTI